MTDIAQTASSDPLIHAAGGFALVSGLISAIGVVCLVTMFALFATPNKTLALTFGLVNDICIAVQYLLTIPIALALHRILQPYNPGLMRVATAVGLVAMVSVIALTLALVFGAVTFERQAVWVTLAMIGGVGAWLIMTAMVARATGRMPNSGWWSGVAVPYLGYPAWAFWLGRILLNW